MIVFRRFRIGEQERGLLFKDGDFQGVLPPGRRWFADPFRRIRVDTSSTRQGWIEHPDLDVIMKSGALGAEATILEVGDRQRLLVWFDGRFQAVRGPGRYAIWTAFREVRCEVIDVVGGAASVRLVRDDADTILRGDGAADWLIPIEVGRGEACLWYVDGELVGTLAPGSYGFWRGAGRVTFERVDVRQRVLDIGGQDIMTSDKVTLRVNAVVTFRVTDPVKAVSSVDDYAQALYREAQLALRAVIGTRELDALLTDKDDVSSELLRLLGDRARRLGVEVESLGIRDLILPGDMKTLLNRVTEAKKAAEAALITRREETAAMRSQANTARLLEGNPMLMRLRELEVLEKVADKANLSVVLGEQGLSERVMKLL